MMAPPIRKKVISHVAKINVRQSILIFRKCGQNLESLTMALIKMWGELSTETWCKTMMGTNTLDSGIKYVYYSF